MILLIALALAQAEAPPDPACPQGDLAVARGPGSVCVGRLTDAYLFSSIWPAEAAAVPALDALLRQDAAESERWIAAQAQRHRREAAEAEAEPVRLSYEAGWTADAIVPAPAALSSARSTYTGGAHGGIAYRVILFDRRRSEPITLGDLFADRNAGMAVVQRAFCDGLRAELRNRRGDEARDEQCPLAGDQPISLVAGATGRITALRALIPPYVVGSYAEGPYEFDFAVTDDLIAALKPDYRSAFAVPSG